MSLPSSDFEEVGFDDGLAVDSFETGSEEAVVTPKAAGPVYRKQSFNIYSVLLIVSFVFLVTSLILLFMEVGRLTK